MKLRISHLLAAAAIFATQSAMALITGSAHDFSANLWANGEICVPCHAPHNNLSTTGLLWNHSPTSAIYTLYSSVTMNATLGQPAATSPTKLCLSCHDGTVAVDNFGGVTTGTTFITGGALLGTNLANDHPVAFTYNTALATADGGLFDPAAKPAVANLLYGYAAGSGSVECSSCHDVHNKYALPSLLKVTNAASALCLTCHNK